MEPTLWPARNIAEYAYCPRLFYLMEVEGIHIASGDTEEGISVHGRVDRPSAAPADDPDKPQSVRSLVLTSMGRALTATLDLADMHGTRAVPIEYRRGRPQRHPPGEDTEDIQARLAEPRPWPTDRIQLALQGILLEDAGYEVSEGVLYYAAEKLRLTIAITAELKAEALGTLKVACAAAEGPRPPPLVNDPKCVRCSLQAYCLPDEINFETQEQTPSPRKLWPPRDDGIHVIAQSHGTRIGIRGLALTVTDGDGGRIRQIPLATVESLSLLGSVQLSTQALQTLARQGIPVGFLSPLGRPVAILDPLDSVSAQVRRAQVRVLDNAQKALELSRELVVAKIMNQRTLLMRNHPNLPQAVSISLRSQALAAGNAASLDGLRGFEGAAASLYFEHLAGVLPGSFAEAFDAIGRQRRPPPDPVNAGLSLGYTLLTHECVTALRLARLEPSIGAFHVSRPGRPALALDLMEPFRPLIVDSIIIGALNRGELKAGHFWQTAAGCSLTDAGRRAFFDAYGRRMQTEITHPHFGYRLSYRRMLTLHARMIAAWLAGEIPTLSFLTTR